VTIVLFSRFLTLSCLAASTCFALTEKAALPAAPVCSATPLSAIEYPEALAFESGTSPDTGNLKPALVSALEKFKELVNAMGGRFELQSGYRSPAYQAHLQEVWKKWMELRPNREPACQQLRAQLKEEFERHHLLERQMPATASDHTRGLAFDATVILPRFRKRRVSLDSLARMAGIKRPDIRHDPVHFRLTAPSNT
jgi:hypothetical protein